MHHYIRSEISKLFGDVALKKTVTELTDTSMPFVCHNRPFPCSTLNENAYENYCMNTKLINNLMVFFFNLFSISLIV